MTRALAFAVVVQAVLTLIVGLIVLDMRAHNRVERLGGVNVWGYRGLELGRKQQREVRIVVFGGDLAFGWGVSANETMANYVAQLVSLEVNQRGRRPRLITPIVAAARGMAPTDYAGWIRRDRDLLPDIICLVPDEPGRRLDTERFLPDRHSRIFAATGYSPILPLVLREKAALTHSPLLGTAARVLAAVDIEADTAAAAPANQHAALTRAIDAALHTATTGVVLVLPPRWDDRTPMVPADDRLRTVRLAADRMMAGDELRLDGYHFSAGGHSQAAQSVAPVALDFVRRMESEGR